MSDKFISPSPPPEGIKRELLTILAEECCEVGHRVSKALRFGIDEVQPGQNLTNADRIMQEVGDLSAVLQLLEEHGVVDAITIREFHEKKMPKLHKYLQSENSDT